MHIQKQRQIQPTNTCIQIRNGKTNTNTLHTNTNTYAKAINQTHNPKYISTNTGAIAENAITQANTYTINKYIHANA